MRPLPLGFVVNSACASLFVFGLARARRMRRLAVRMPVSGRVAVIIACAIGLNVTVSLGLWVKWQFATQPRKTTPLRYQKWKSADSEVLSFQNNGARCAAKVPSTWPQSPSWIGFGGEALGVRTYELTSHGIPSAAWAWLYVTWGPGASDRHQSMNVVQAGFPLPALQSEELIEVQGRTSNSAEDVWLQRGPIERRGGMWNVKLPGAPAPTWEADPSAIIPVRPLWLGFVVNTMLFACVLALLAWMPSGVRVWMRRRKGRCVLCGYELGSSERCSECGLLTRVEG